MLHVLMKASKEIPSTHALSVKHALQEMALELVNPLDEIVVSARSSNAIQRDVELADVVVLLVGDSIPEDVIQVLNIAKSFGKIILLIGWNIDRFDSMIRTTGSLS